MDKPTNINNLTLKECYKLCDFSEIQCMSKSKSNVKCEYRYEKCINLCNERHFSNNKFGIKSPFTK